MLKIKELCSDRGITQKELARRLGIAELTIRNVKEGCVSIKMLQRIASELGVKLPELFADQPPPLLRCPRCGAELEIHEKK